MSEDPFPPVDGIDPYRYGLSSPTTTADPLGLWSLKLSFYYGYGGSLTVGYDGSNWFVRGAFGFGLGGGVTFNPTAKFPRPQNAVCYDKEFFIGASGWLGVSLGPISAGVSGTAGLHGGRRGDQIILSYIEQGSPYGSLKGDAGWGLKLGGGVNIVDVGLAW